MPEYTEDYDRFDHLCDTDTLALRDLARRLDRENQAWMNGVADFVEPMGFDREAACGPADLLPGLRFMHDHIVNLLNALDWRAESGDADPYFQARHDLEMALATDSHFGGTGA